MAPPGGQQSFAATTANGGVAPKAVVRGERDPYVDQVFFAVGKVQSRHLQRISCSDSGGGRPNAAQRDFKRVKFFLGWGP
jgi:hypothetical protein